MPYILPATDKVILHGFIDGWRVFQIRGTGRFSSPIHNFGRDKGVWYSSRRRAKCTYQGNQIVRHKEGRLQYLDHPAAPVEHCHCGFYGYNDYQALYNYAWYYETHALTTAVAQVKVWGKVIPAQRGFRAQWMKVTKLYVSPHLPRLTIDVFGEHYPDIEIATKAELPEPNVSYRKLPDRVVDLRSMAIPEAEVPKSVLKRYR